MYSHETEKNKLMTRRPVHTPCLAIFSCGLIGFGRVSVLCPHELVVSCGFLSREQGGVVKRRVAIIIW